MRAIFILFTLIGFFAVSGISHASNVSCYAWVGQAPELVGNTQYPGGQPDTKLATACDQNVSRCSGNCSGKYM